MNKKITSILVASFVAIFNPGLGQKSSKASDIPQQPWFGFKDHSAPAMMFPGIISIGSQETNGTFSPDGKEFFYSTEFLYVGSTIIYLKFENGKWSDPEIAPFSGRHRDIDPMFSPDGNRVYFTSRRPLHDTLSHLNNTNLWYVERTELGYGEPIQVGIEINTSEDQFNNSVSVNRSIFFHSRNEVSRSFDIFKASLDNGRYLVTPLDSAINSSHGEYDPYIAPDETYLIFSSDRPGGLGGTDLYISYAKGGSWTKPQNLGVPINSGANDYAPIVSGRILTLTSARFLEPWNEGHKENYGTLTDKIQGPDNGLNNIWWMNIDFIENMRPVGDSEN